MHYCGKDLVVKKQSVVSNGLVLAKESDNLLKICLITHTPIIIAALVLVDESLDIPLPSRAVKGHGCHCRSPPIVHPLGVCDCNRISLAVEIRLVVLDGGVAFFGNAIKIRLQGAWARGAWANK